MIEDDRWEVPVPKYSPPRPILLESPVFREPQLKFPDEETATKGRFQLNGWENFQKVSCLKLKGATWKE